MRVAFRRRAGGARRRFAQPSAPAQVLKPQPVPPMSTFKLPPRRRGSSRPAQNVFHEREGRPLASGRWHVVRRGVLRHAGRHPARRHDERRVREVAQGSS